MTPSTRPNLLSALAALRAALEAPPRPAMLVGGLAVIARGIPRQNIDIDATVGGAGLDIAWIRSIVTQFYATLDEPERLIEFDALIGRALSQR